MAYLYWKQFEIRQMRPLLLQHTQGIRNGTPPALEIGHLVLCEAWSYRLQTWVEV